MGRIAQNKFGIPLIVNNDLRDSLATVDVDTLKKCEHVLVVDDVLNSGSRVEEFNRSLRERFGHLKSVSFLVGVARPCSEREWTRTLKATSTKHSWHGSIQFVERIYLPRWDERECPWCAEFDFLVSVSEKLPDPPDWLNSRISQLAERQKGIVRDPLLLIPGVRSRNLGDQSLVGPVEASPQFVVFSIASALQALRHDKDEPNRLNPHFPDWRVFGIPNLAYYSESLLRAILLKLVTPSEWGGDRRTELQQAIMDHTSKVTDDLLLGEILVAMSRTILLPPSRDNFRRLYSHGLGIELAHFEKRLSVA